MNWNMYKIRIINGVWYWSICVSINNLVKCQLLLWTIQRFKISVVEAKMTFLVSNFCCSFKFHFVMLISCWTAVKDPFQPLLLYRLHKKKPFFVSGFSFAIPLLILLEQNELFDYFNFYFQVFSFTDLWLIVFKLIWVMFENEWKHGLFDVVPKSWHMKILCFNLGLYIQCCEKKITFFSFSWYDLWTSKFTECMWWFFWILVRWFVDHLSVIYY